MQKHKSWRRRPGFPRVIKSREEWQDEKWEGKTNKKPWTGPLCIMRWFFDATCKWGTFHLIRLLAEVCIN